MAELPDGDFIHEAMQKYGAAIEPSPRDVERLQAELARAGLLPMEAGGAGQSSWLSSLKAGRGLGYILGASSLIAALTHAALTGHRPESSARNNEGRADTRQQDDETWPRDLQALKSSPPDHTTREAAAQPGAPTFVEPAEGIPVVGAASKQAAARASAAVSLRDASGRDPSALAEELRSLAQVHELILNQAFVQARRALTRHRSRFADGVLAVEAESLCFVLACHLNQPGSYERARQFLAQKPQPPLAQRISVACRL